jgi:hypothetical protein
MSPLGMLDVLHHTLTRDKIMLAIAGIIHDSEAALRHTKAATIMAIMRAIPRGVHPFGLKGPYCSPLSMFGFNGGHV